MQLSIFKQTRVLKGMRLWLLISALWGFVAVAQEVKPNKTTATQASTELAKQVAPEGTKPEQELNQQADASEQPPADFDLLELRVKGNTLLDPKELGRTVYPFLGLKKTIDTVESARAALEKVYQGKGYQTVAVDIPEQDVKNGIVNLQVVEGKVSRLRVVESRYFTLGKIKAGVPELAEGKIPNFPKMQKELAALGGQSEDRKIQPILRAGETPGTLEVDLKVKDKLPFHGKLELNGGFLAL
jgi:hemolysin activation/secretion protein